MVTSCVPIDSATALRVGLINEILPADRLLPRALEVASAIAVHDPGLIAIA
jgi:enoyl-CoA hydratase/carnithine racemase